jgi:hypothetical protein
MNIYVKFKKPKTVKEFLYTFFCTERIGYGCTTYNDEACTSIQCYNDKMRSFDEVYLMVKTYFPIATRRRVIHEILTLDYKFGDGQFLVPFLSHCSTIQKIRITYQKLPYVSIGAPFHLDHYKSTHSWTEILSLIGIKNQRDLIVYVSKDKTYTTHPIIKEINSIDDILRLGNCTLEDVTPFKEPKNDNQKLLNKTALMMLIANIYNGENKIKPGISKYIYVDTKIASMQSFGTLNECYFTHPTLAIDAYIKFPEIYKID